MLPGTTPYERMLAGVPVRSWVLEEHDYDDDNFHGLVTPPAGMRIVVTDMSCAIYVAPGNDVFLHLEWGFQLGGSVSHVYPMSIVKESSSVHVALRTHWVLPVNAILGPQREAGTLHYCVSALGYFVTSDIAHNQRF